MKENVKTKSLNGSIGVLAITRGSITSYIITTIVFIIYALLLTYTEMTEKNIQTVVIITTVVSVLIGGIMCAKNTKSKGLIYGMICGVIYSIIMVMVSFCILPEIVFSPKIIMIIILSICSGGVGGIIGINIKK